MLNVLAAARRRASAFRRFPPSCGRCQHAPQPLPPQDKHPSTTQLPNSARAGTTKASSPGDSLHAGAFAGTERPDLGGGKGLAAERKVLAGVATARRLSAVRRYPPGCGRGAAAPQPQALVGGSAAKNRVGDNVVLCVSLDHGELSDGRKNGGDGDEEEGGGWRLVVAGFREAMLCPWTQRSKRSQRRRKPVDKLHKY